MILWRALQGFLGAGMIPTVFASAYTVFPRSKFHIVGPIIGLVATLAPTIGPTVGGYITDRDVVALAVLHQRRCPASPSPWACWRWSISTSRNFELLDRFDWWGLLFMAGFLGTLEYVLEEGPQYEWLQDTSVAICAVDLRRIGDRLLLARLHGGRADRQSAHLLQPQLCDRPPVCNSASASASTA